MSRDIYTLESKEQRSADEEQRLQHLLLDRSNLLGKLKAESAAAAAPSTESDHKQAVASHAPAPADALPPSIIDSILSSVADATNASVGLAKSVAGLLLDSAADTARLCAPPPPSLEQTLKQLDGNASSPPPCVLHMLPLDIKALPAPPPLAVSGSTKQLLSNFCEHTLLMDSSVHGRSNKRFHDLCDASGPTLALFLVANNLFGYYLSKSSGMGIQKAAGSFMFSVFRGGCYRPAVYRLLDDSFQLLPSAANGSLPVGWSAAKDEAGAVYYCCESTRHVQARPPLVDRQQMNLGPRLFTLAAVHLSCADAEFLPPIRSPRRHLPPTPWCRLGTCDLVVDFDRLRCGPRRSCCRAMRCAAPDAPHSSLCFSAKFGTSRATRTHAGAAAAPAATRPPAPRFNHHTSSFHQLFPSF